MISLSKTLLFALTLSTTSLALAAHRCDESVSAQYQNHIETQTENRFDFVRHIDRQEAESSINDSYYLRIEKKAESLSKISEQGVVLYDGVSNYMSGTEQELLIVNESTCEITGMYFWASE
ncbi:MAG: hypothetical protein V4654_02610 [Bdellovibrionota bacterium]